jgi:hypothetical protein
VAFVIGGALTSLELTLGLPLASRSALPTIATLTRLVSLRLPPAE